MAVLNKAKFLMLIARLVAKNSVSFEGKDRPSFESDGKKFFVGGVSFDQDKGEMVYSLLDAAGKLVGSRNGSRPLSGLDIKTLSKVSETVRKYFDLHRSRERNLVNIESRLRASRKEPRLSM